MPIGNLTAFLQYLMQILFAVLMAVIMFVFVPRAAVSAGRIQEVLDTEPLGPRSGAARRHSPRTRHGAAPSSSATSSSAIRAPRSRSSTTSRSRPRPGETTAIVGSTGSGKSTLVNLIPRFYDATKGAVLVDGVDVRELDRSDLWRVLGVVPQKSFLFSGTVASNLRFGDQDATDEELWHALDIAQARDFVEEMEGGLEAPITQGGTNLSGGQRQRLAIARALVKKAEVYIFDDSFSALDFSTDARLRAALEREVGGATLIIVAQRVGTIMKADRIVVMDAGRIVGSGTHTELLGIQRDVPRDRLLAAVRRRGRRMSGRPGAGGPPAGGSPASGGRPALGRRCGAARGGPGGMFGGMPAEKSKDFRASFRRLLFRLRPERPLIVLVFILAIVSVVVRDPRPEDPGQRHEPAVRGRLGKSLPAGRDQGADRSPGCGPAATTRRRTCSRACTSCPARASTSARSAASSIVLIGFYVAELGVQLAAGLHHGRGHPADRLPVAPGRRREARPAAAQVLRQPPARRRPQPGHERHRQHRPDAPAEPDPAHHRAADVIGVLVMMLLISPILAVVSVLAVPLSIVVTVLIAGRSQKQFVAQWASTGTLNGHVEEMHTGHSIVKVFGRQQEAIETFDRENEKLYDASYRAQFISGIIQPAMNFIANLNYVAIAVIGGLRVAAGQMSLGDVIAFIQYSRQFTFPIIQTASIANVLQSAVASAERVFELLDEPEEIPDPVAPRVLSGAARRGRRSRTCRSGTSRTSRSSTTWTWTCEAGQTVAIVGPTGAGKTTLVNLLMRFYEIDGGRITVDGIDTRELTRDDLRRTFGMVLQDTWLFHGTIRENIAYGRAGRDRGRDRGRRRGRPRGPLRPDAARRLRHGHRRRRHEPLARASGSS